MPQCDIDFKVSKYPGAQVHMTTSILLFHNMALEVNTPVTLESVLTRSYYVPDIL